MVLKVLKVLLLLLLLVFSFALGVKFADKFKGFMETTEQVVKKDETDIELDLDLEDKTATTSTTAPATTTNAPVSSDGVTTQQETSGDVNNAPVSQDATILSNPTTDTESPVKQEYLNDSDLVPTDSAQPQGFQEIQIEGANNSQVEVDLSPDGAGNVNESITIQQQTNDASSQVVPPVPPVDGNATDNTSIPPASQPQQQEAQPSKEVKNTKNKKKK